MTNYSHTKCSNPNCSSTLFETVHDTPKDSNYELQYIRCYQCKTIVSVMDKHNISAQLKMIATHLGLPF